MLVYMDRLGRLDWVYRADRGSWRTFRLCLASFDGSIRLLIIRGFYKGSADSIRVLCEFRVSGLRVSCCCFRSACGGLDLRPKVKSHPKGPRTPIIGL